jgi:hypothetical protein
MPRGPESSFFLSKWDIRHPMIINHGLQDIFLIDSSGVTVGIENEIVNIQNGNGMSAVGHECLV